jgi:preprotein translocase subunit SecF
VLSAFSNMVVTLAVINLIGIKLSTAGVAAFLMLIGYSVDTNILLSTKVLKRKGGRIIERIISGMKTGLLMTLTTFTAVLIAFIFSQSEALSQIMLILMIGLLMDVLNTWIQNAGILRIYLEKKGKK